MPKSHATPMDRGMHEDEGGKIVISEIAKEDIFTTKHFPCFPFTQKTRPRKEVVMVVDVDQGTCPLLIRLHYFTP